MPNNNPHTLNLMQRHAPVCLCIIVAALLLSGCHRSEPVQFHRFEHLLFDTPVNRLQAEMKEHQAEYNSELIVLYPDEPEFIEMTQEFVADPVMRDIYRITDSMYHDLSDVERQLGRALGRAYKLCPKMWHVERFYTMATGDFNYNFRVFSNCGDLCVCLDQYALGAMEKYQYFGFPSYLVRTLAREYIVPDCMYTLAGLYLEAPDGDLTLLDYAVAEGKKLYFMEKTMPGIADTLLLHYTVDQLKWMKDNEKNVWGWLIQNKLLYSTDQSAWRNLLGEAPHTNAFGNESAPRVAAYIGWQIVRAYMKKSGATLDELMADTESQKILSTSAWRP
ncbi:MAG: hypothetical protein IJ524_05845 [Bacteroidales bacterium]|nr:hypothetical protein [Bacteroidales bacterium]